MNDTIKTILNRRSIRNYSNEQLKNEELDLIIKAGLYAPSAHNQQPWHFTVIQDKKVINYLNRAAKNEMLKSEDIHLREVGQDNDFDIFYDAPTVIVISGEKSAICPQFDSSAATENMLLAAESLNIGTCWIGYISILFRSDRVQECIKSLGIPDGFEPYYAVTLGYKAEENREAAPRRENTVNFIKG